MSPVIFYTLVLGIVDVLQYFLVPLCASRTAPASPAARPTSSTSTCTRRSSRSRTWPTGRPSRGCCSAITLAVTLVAVPDLAALGLLRGGALGGGPGRRRHGRRCAGRQRAPGRGRGRASPPLAAPAATPGDAAKSFALTILVRRVPGGVPVADRALGAHLAQDARPAVRDGCAVPAVAAAHVRVRGPDPSTSTSCRSTASSASWRIVKKGRQESTFIDPAEPDGARSSGRAPTGRSRGPGRCRRRGELRRRLGPHRLPAAAVQHDRARGHRHGRDGRLVHARRLRLRALPVPRPVACCSRCSSRRSSCRRR